MGSVHDKHRERVRKEFLARGFNENTPEHKVLEMLLFYSIPRVDTNELAHILIKRFGSFSALLEAKPEEIMKVKGVGENTTALIKLMLPIIALYQNQKLKPVDRYDDMNEISNYLMKKYIGFTKEIFSVMSFDSSGRLCGFDYLSSGDVASVGISSRMVAETVIKNNATSIIIAHNHPGGNALPSADDIHVTEKIANALKHINVNLIDHIILCDDDYVSLEQSVQYKYLFE